MDQTVLRRMLTVVQGIFIGDETIKLKEVKKK